MSTNQYQVGPQIVPKGQGPSNARGDYSGAGVFQQGQGKYAELVRQGQLFNYSVTAAAALLAPGTTACGPCWWNPIGSGVIFYPLVVTQNWLSGATTAGSVYWALTQNAGANIGTAAPVVTFTNVAPVNMALGSTNAQASAMRFAPITATYAVAPVFFMAAGFNYKSEVGDYLGVIDYDGALAVYPGNALTLCYSVATSTALYWTSVLGAEVPLT
jgi:hypothetical protein